jgi:hypothetical protein
MLMMIKLIDQTVVRNIHEIGHSNSTLTAIFFVVCYFIAVSVLNIVPLLVYRIIVF